MEESTPYRIALTQWVIVHWHSPTERTVVRRLRLCIANQKWRYQSILAIAKVKVMPPSPNACLNNFNDF